MHMDKEKDNKTTALVPRSIDTEQELEPPAKRRKIATANLRHGSTNEQNSTHEAGHKQALIPTTSSLPDLPSQYGFRIKKNSGSSDESLLAAVVDQIRHESLLHFPQELKNRDIAAALRRIMADCIIANIGMYEKFNVGQSILEIERRIQNLEDDQKWISEEGLYALTNALQIDAVVINESTENLDFYSPEGGGQIRIHVYRNRLNHYKSLHKDETLNATRDIEEEIEKDDQNSVASNSSSNVSKNASGLEMEEEMEEHDGDSSIDSDVPLDGLISIPETVMRTIGKLHSEHRFIQEKLSSHSLSKYEHMKRVLERDISHDSLSADLLIPALQKDYKAQLGALKEQIQLPQQRRTEKDFEAREISISAIGELVQEAPFLASEIYQYLLTEFKNVDQDTQAKIGDALIRLVRVDPTYAVKALDELLKICEESQYEETRDNVAGILHNMLPILDKEVACNKLVQALESEHEYVRAASVFSLATLAQMVPGNKAWKALLKACHDRDKDTRQLAAKAIVEVVKKQPRSASFIVGVLLKTYSKSVDSRKTIKSVICQVIQTMPTEKVLEAIMDVNTKQMRQAVRETGALMSFLSVIPFSKFADALNAILTMSPDTNSETLALVKDSIAALIDDYPEVEDSIMKALSETSQNRGFDSVKKEIAAFLQARDVMK